MARRCLAGWSLCVCHASFIVAFPVSVCVVDTPAIPLVLIIVGLLPVFANIIWPACKSAVDDWRRMKIHEQNIEVYTIERRPSSPPPPYQESETCHRCPEADPEDVEVQDGVQVVLSLAPPLYCQDSTQSPDCTWSWEQPPPYEDTAFETCGGGVAHHGAGRCGEDVCSLEVDISTELTRRDGSMERDTKEDIALDVLVF